MARMLRANLSRKGRCHPWCEPPEHVVGRAAENQQWRRGARSMTTAQAHRLWVAGHLDHDERTCPVCREGESDDRHR